MAKKPDLFVVYYAWLKDHQECRAHTVVTARSQLEAMGKFQRQNPHVVVVEDGTVSNDPTFRVNLATKIHEQLNLKPAA